MEVAMEKTVEKIVCGYGQTFYTDCKSSPRVRELLLKFQFTPTLSNAEVLLNDSEAEKYCDSIADICASECPLFEVSMRRRGTLLQAAEARPGGLCPAALFEKAALLSLGWWK